VRRPGLVANSRVDSHEGFTHLPADSRGRDRATESGAEGATAPETLRQKDRDELMNAGKQPRCLDTGNGSPKEQRAA
jgi:hypothetical protein